MRAYSLDLRQKVMAKLEEGYSIREVAKMFGINFTTVSRWKKDSRERGTLEPKKRANWNRKIDREKLRADVEARPDDYLYERAERFGCTGEAIRLALKEMGIIPKKNTKSPKSKRRN